MNPRPLLTAAQIELLKFIGEHRCQYGVYTMDNHYRATTFESLRRRKLIGYFTLPRKWTAPSYVITPAGRAVLEQHGGSNA